MQKPFHPHQGWCTRKPGRRARRTARKMLAATGKTTGYCLAYGVDEGDLVAALIQQSERPS